jgi:hypothetical protein
MVVGFFYQMNLKYVKMKRNVKFNASIKYYPKKCRICFHVYAARDNLFVDTNAF